jgi:hypothetical protein
MNFCRIYSATSDTDAETLTTYTMTAMWKMYWLRFLYWLRVMTAYE